MTDATTCHRCGGPATRTTVLVRPPRGPCYRLTLPLPPDCADPECRAAERAENDHDAIEDAIARGVINR